MTEIELAAHREWLMWEAVYQQIVMLPYDKLYDNAVRVQVYDLTFVKLPRNLIIPR